MEMAEMEKRYKLIIHQQIQAQKEAAKKEKELDSLRMAHAKKASERRRSSVGYTGRESSLFSILESPKASSSMTTTTSTTNVETSSVETQTYPIEKENNDTEKDTHVASNMNEEMNEEMNEKMSVEMKKNDVLNLSITNLNNERKKEKEEDIREECQEEMVEALMEQASELKTMYTEKHLIELNKIKKLLQIEQELNKNAMQDSKTKKETDGFQHEKMLKLKTIQKNQKEMVQDCEEELGRFRLQTASKETALARTEKELETTTNALIAKEEAFVLLQEEHDEDLLIVQNKIQQLEKQLLKSENEKEISIHELTEQFQQTSLEQNQKALTQQNMLSSAAGQNNIALTERLDQVTKEMQDMNDKNNESVQIIEKLQKDIIEMNKLKEMNQLKQEQVNQEVIQTKEMNEQEVNEQVNVLKQQHESQLEELKTEHNAAIDTTMKELKELKVQNQQLIVGLQKNEQENEKQHHVVEKTKQTSVLLEEAQLKVEHLEELALQQDDKWRIVQENTERDHMTKLSNMRNIQNTLETEKNEIETHFKESVDMNKKFEKEILNLKKNVAEKEIRIQTLVSSSSKGSIVLPGTEQHTPVKQSKRSKRSTSKSDSDDEFQPAESKENTIDLTNTPDDKKSVVKKKRGGRFAWLKGKKKKSSNDATPVARRTRSGRSSIAK